MKPFGSLPRPQSRFRRPQHSWFRRVLSAGKLRLSFLVVYALVAGSVFLYLYGLAREYGYFYRLEERQALWRRYPEDSAMQTLVAIYGPESKLPELRLVRQRSNPLGDDSLADLIKDPHWKARALQVRSLGFDARLKDLETTPWFARLEGVLAATDNGRDLNPEQRRRLDALRRLQVEWFIREAQPESEARTQAFRFRLGGWYSRPWPLDSKWREIMLTEARRQQHLLVAKMAKGVRLEELRRMQVAVRLVPLEPELRAPLLALAARTPHNQVVMLAHFKKLLPEFKLPPDQTVPVECLADLTTNP